MSDRKSIEEAYSVLELKPGASQAEIKNAYRKLVKIWHPDNFPQPQHKQQAEEKIKLINEAYNKLKSYQPTYTEQPHQASESYPTPIARVYVNSFNAEGFYNDGVENAKLGRYEDALSDFTHAIRLNPNYIEAYKYRGYVCSVLGYEHRATSDLDKAAQLEGQLKIRENYSSPSSRRSKRSQRKSKSKSLIGGFFSD
ncbi:DnaJ domain-containing protein [Scytonema sp. UIC 10036]|uniref:J domain-containing protein n=1 Tax=Scytonema sp. UIC 10036 TaxID=2304196 RepID=UPI0012DAD203|nr:DnaJ domain-containing protein [Scytonema sp. UIC 10036]MUG91607.1 DnaJ domain-containing protein [Scytonema sp. UIC 10036]